jgi:uncharacterized membrane protein HdeD (DUF308 family)
VANGLGIILLVLGLLLLLGAVDLPDGVQGIVSATTLGWTLLIAGVITRLSGLALDSRRRAADPNNGRED